MWRLLVGWGMRVMGLATRLATLLLELFMGAYLMNKDPTDCGKLVSGWCSAGIQLTVVFLLLAFKVAPWYHSLFPVTYIASLRTD